MPTSARPGAKWKTRRFFAGRAWFFIPLVGADDSVRPLKSCNFVRSFVGADAHIGPSKYCDFASDFRKNAQFRRADRVVRPYGAKSRPIRIRRKPIIKRAFPAGRCGHRPLRCKMGNAAIFRRTRVVFHTPCRGGRPCPPFKIRRFSRPLRCETGNAAHRAAFSNANPAPRFASQSLSKNF